MFYYKINKNNLTDNNFWIKFVHDLQSSLMKEESFENKILVIKLQNITNDNNNLIPKITHQQQQDWKIQD
jgi:hypothetical protein